MLIEDTALFCDPESRPLVYIREWFQWAQKVASVGPRRGFSGPKSGCSPEVASVVPRLWPWTKTWSQWPKVVAVAQQQIDKNGTPGATRSSMTFYTLLRFATMVYAPKSKTHAL